MAKSVPDLANVVQNRRRTSAAPTNPKAVPVTAFYPDSVRRELKILALQQNRTLRDLLAEGLNDLFAKYGRPEIAPRD